MVNSVSPTADELLIETINLQYHPTLMAAAGDLAITTATQALSSGISLLVVEGAVPTSHDRYCTVWETAEGHMTMLEAVQNFASAADYVMAVGSCAAFGGITGRSADTGAQSVGNVLTGRPVINVPGCPAHPDWIIGTIAHVLASGLPPLDADNRPTAYFGEKVHRLCPRKGNPAETFGEEGLCMQGLGCQGRWTRADCPSRQWNNSVNWCVGANGLCIGCTESSFPRFPLHQQHGNRPGRLFDFNGNDVVDVADIQQVANRWSARYGNPNPDWPPYNSLYDIDGDDDIDIVDIMLVAAQWGATCP